MDEKPIPRDEGIFARGLWKKNWLECSSLYCSDIDRFLYQGFCQLLATSPPSLEVGQTVAFLVLAYSSILHVFNVRSSKSIFKVDLATNKSLAQMAWLALGITTAIALIPQTQELFYLVPISMNHWIIMILLSLVRLL
ncbi:MAG: cation transporting ATPase C-terminal domain-containing protein [Enterococcus sp.]|uniref:cation transporting ATPase C-terminal domain-containing protein n=1 Tax=Enterococcus sp. TaxID=35783 RepID=UPI003991705A